MLGVQEEGKVTNATVLRRKVEILTCLKAKPKRKECQVLKIWTCLERREKRMRRQNHHVGKIYYGVNSLGRIRGEENDVVSPKEFYDNVYSRKNRRFRNLGILF